MSNNASTNAAEAMAKFLPMINSQVLLDAIQCPRPEQPEWLWHDQASGAMTYGRWSRAPNTTSYVRTDIVLSALASLTAERDAAVQRAMDYDRDCIDMRYQRDAAESRAANAVAALRMPSDDMVDAIACVVAGHVTLEQLKANKPEARYARKMAREVIAAICTTAVETKP